jgi:hypothetical protein
MSSEQYWATTSVIVAKKISGIQLRTAEPGFLARLAACESGEFIDNVVKELFSPKLAIFA